MATRLTQKKAAKTAAPGRVRSTNPKSPSLSRAAQSFLRYLVFNPGTPKYLCYMKYFPNASKEAAAVAATRMLKNANAQAYLAEIEARLEEQYQITEERIMSHLAMSAFVDPSEIFGDNGKIRRLDEMTPQARKCIQLIKSRVQRGRGGDDSPSEIQEVKLYNRLEALKQLSTILGLVKGKRAANGSTGFFEALLARISPSGKPESVNRSRVS